MSNGDPAESGATAATGATACPSFPHEATPDNPPKCPPGPARYGKLYGGWQRLQWQSYE